MPMYTNEAFKEAVGRFDASLGAVEDYSIAIDRHLTTEHRLIMRRYSLALMPELFTNLKNITEKRTPTEEESEALKDMSGLLAAAGVVIDESERTIKAPKPLTSAMEYATKIHTANHRKERLARESALIMGLSSAEVLVAELARQYFLSNPEKIDDANYKITFAEIATYASIDDARAHIVDRRISDLTHGNVVDWILQVTQFYHAGAGFIDAHKDRLREIGLRRNLLVHNGGVVNSFYVKNADKAVRSSAPIGERLTVSSRYLSQTLDTLRITFLMLVAECWKKALGKGSCDEIASYLNALSYEALSKERWLVSGALSDFVTREKSISSQARLIALFNYWQSLKWSGRFDEVEPTVRDFDITTLGTDYRLAKHALLDERDAFFKELRKAAGAGDFNSLKAYDWPIFREMRKEKQFKAILEPYGILRGTQVSASNRSLAALLFQRTEEAATDTEIEKPAFEFIEKSADEPSPPKIRPATGSARKRPKHPQPKNKNSQKKSSQKRAR